MFSLFKKKEEQIDMPDTLYAILSGRTIPIETVPDEIFAGKLLGDGVAFEAIDEPLVVAPADCEIISASEDMKHACGMKLANGMEILIHIGIDTVDMQGDGFEVLVQEGNMVEKGTPLIQFDIEKIKAAGHPTTTMMIVTDMGQAREICFETGQSVSAGVTKIAEEK